MVSAAPRPGTGRGEATIPKAAGRRLRCEAGPCPAAMPWIGRVLFPSLLLLPGGLQSVVPCRAFPERDPSSTSRPLKL